MHFDVLIRGGGIQGATAACDAARRGLSVLLVEREDLGGGASSNSMKIVHGGLRYLQSLDLGRSRESIRERRRLLTMAPDLVRPLPCRMDMTGRPLWFRALFRGGLIVGDLLSADRNRGVPGANRVPRSRYPVWYDGIVDDTERLLLRFVHAAMVAQPDSRVITHGTAELVREEGRVVGARTEALGDVSVGAVLDCTGAHGGDRPAMMSMNLVIDALPLTREGAVALRHPEDGRAVFAVPWNDRTIVGTWNGPYDGNPADPFRLRPHHVQSVLDFLTPVHPQFALIDRSRIRLVHAGLLPADTPAGPDPSSRPVVRSGTDGVVTLSGVKWTTAYGVSQCGVDRVIRALGRGHAAPPTSLLPDPSEWLDALCDADPSLRAPVARATPLTIGALRFAVEREWARTLEDVMLRRTGLASAGHPGRRVTEAVAVALQPLLDWSDEERRAQVDSFHADERFAGNVPD